MRLLALSANLHIQILCVVLNFFQQVAYHKALFPFLIAYMLLPIEYSSWIEKFPDFLDYFVAKLL